MIKKNYPKGGAARNFIYKCVPKDVTEEKQTFQPYNEGYHVMLIKFHYLNFFIVMNDF